MFFSNSDSVIHSVVGENAIEIQSAAWLCTTRH